jgi:hypothetical protein
MNLKPIRPIHNLFGLILFIVSPGVNHAFDQGYLDAVKADVEEFSTHEFLPPADSAWLGDKENLSAQIADLQGFSEFVRTQSPGSYIFYKKLSGEYKNRLHQDYLSTGDLQRLKQDIFEYTRETKNMMRSNRHLY